MAKRKRLSPAKDSYLGTDMPDLETKAFGVARHVTPPIAQVAGEAASAAALQDLADEVKRAKDTGRMILDLPEAAIDAGYLVRDRMMADEEELQVLMQSLRARGQQTPIEVVALGPDRYGLISGWRRLTALRRLSAETGEARFGRVQALIRRPETAEAAYTAMVEENEIRVGLSFYERARVVAKAVEQGVFDTEKTALQTLFANASRAKRSKIKSFLRIYRAADGVLRFPAALSERLGMALSKLFEDRPDIGARLVEDLRARPAESAEAELDRVQDALEAAAKPADAPDADPDPKPAPEVVSLGQGLTARLSPGELRLSGAGVTDALCDRLVAWLRAQQGQ